VFVMARMWGASGDQDESVLRELEEVLAGVSVGGLPFFVSVCTWKIAC
jgi:hypothetical protein